jgi:hypothetical protein
MPEVLRVKSQWTGFSGAPGYTNLHFSEFVSEGYTQAMADGATAKTVAFWDAIKTVLPTVVTITVDPVVDIIQSDTGNLVGEFTTTPGAAKVGLQAGSYAGPAGACIAWGTTGIRNGRRIRGRTFIVPLGTASYEANGTLLAANLTAIQNAANGLIANTGVTDFTVWSRPSSSTATDGVAFPATTAVVRDKVAVLRSRRD